MKEVIQKSKQKEMTSTKKQTTTFKTNKTQKLTSLITSLYTRIQEEDKENQANLSKILTEYSTSNPNIVISYVNKYNSNKKMSFKLNLLTIPSVIKSKKEEIVEIKDFSFRRIVEYSNIMLHYLDSYLTYIEVYNSNDIILNTCWLRVVFNENLKISHFELNYLSHEYHNIFSYSSFINEFGLSCCFNRVLVISECVSRVSCVREKEEEGGNKGNKGN